MKFSEELVKKVTEEMVRDEISKAMKQLEPIIRAQITKYLKSESFLKQIAETIKEEAKDEYLDNSLLDLLTETERARLDKKVVNAIFKI